MSLPPSTDHALARAERRQAPLGRPGRRPGRGTVNDTKVRDRDSRPKSLRVDVSDLSLKKGEGLKKSTVFPPFLVLDENFLQRERPRVPFLSPTANLAEPGPRSVGRSTRARRRRKAALGTFDGRPRRVPCHRPGSSALGFPDPTPLRGPLPLHFLFGLVPSSSSKTSPDPTGRTRGPGTQGVPFRLRVRSYKVSSIKLDGRRRWWGWN